MPMSFEEWEAAGNGAREDESLFDAIGRTVSHQYEWVCPRCDTTNTVYSQRCCNCGHELE
jgi:hypothetical protein